MIYLLWAFVNVAAVVACLMAGIRLLLSSYRSYGLFVTVILFCLLSSFFCSPEKENEKAAPPQSLHFAGGRQSIGFSSDDNVWSIPDSTAGHYQLKGDTTVTVFKNPVFKIRLHVFYGVDTATRGLAPLFARTDFEGWQSGIRWKTFYPVLSTNGPDNELHYRIEGEMKWALAGFDIYTEASTFLGTIPVRL